MYRIVFCILCALFLCTCRQEENTKVYVRIVGGEEQVSTVLRVGERSFSLVLDSIGEAEIDLFFLTEVSEGVLRHGRYELPLFFEPNQSFEVFINLDSNDFGAEFNGEGALKNEIWNSELFSPFPDSVFRLEEIAFGRFVGQKRLQLKTCMDFGEQNDSLFKAKIQERLEELLLKEVSSYSERHTNKANESVKD
ncbi:hypothetical protein [Odoribacter lunatus]|uniref:hypothetical protein n=1 Tax=Odoribacter lunatus TaxID=2941335 RepID=UPI002041E7AA|nr:hypothetical protein [Odoribacter lunatus]